MYFFLGDLVADDEAGMNKAGDERRTTVVKTARCVCSVASWTCAAAHDDISVAVALSGEVPEVAVALVAKGSITPESAAAAVASPFFLPARDVGDRVALAAIVVPTHGRRAVRTVSVGGSRCVVLRRSGKTDVVSAATATFDAGDGDVFVAATESFFAAYDRDRDLREAFDALKTMDLDTIEAGAGVLPVQMIAAVLSRPGLHLCDISVAAVVVRDRSR